MTKPEWFKERLVSYLTIQEICRQINRGEFEQDPPTRIGSLNTKKQEPSNWIKIQNTKIKAKYYTGQHHKTNFNTWRQNICRVNKRIMNVNKNILPSLRNQDWKKIKVSTNKVNKLLPNIPMRQITELSKLIYAGEKLVCDKIGITPRNPTRNTNPGWKIRQEGQVKKLRQQEKVLRKEKYARAS